MFCEKCGNQIPDNATFCEKCGAPTNATPGAGPYAAPPPRPAAPQYAAPQYAAPPPQYAAPAYAPPGGEVSVGSWMISLIVCALPFIGFIMTLVWAFGKNTLPSKRNFFRAMLLFQVIAAVLGIIFYSSILGSLM